MDEIRTMTQASSISTPQATASQHGLLDHPLHVRRALVLLVAYLIGYTQLLAVFGQVH